jgi:hypothetical protein
VVQGAKSDAHRQDFHGTAFVSQAGRKLEHRVVDVRKMAFRPQHLVSTEPMSRAADPQQFLNRTFATDFSHIVATARFYPAPVVN